jgi:hypothetical protein
MIIDVLDKARLGTPLRNVSKPIHIDTASRRITYIPNYIAPHLATNVPRRNKIERWKKDGARVL